MNKKLVFVIQIEIRSDNETDIRNTVSGFKEDLRIHHNAYVQLDEVKVEAVD